MCTFTLESLNMAREKQHCIQVQVTLVLYPELLRFKSMGIQVLKYKYIHVLHYKSLYTLCYYIYTMLTLTANNSTLLFYMIYYICSSCN